MISEALGSIRIGSASARRITASGTWGMRYEPFTGSGFHVVLAGNAWLITSTEEPRQLRTGDVVLTPYGGEHGLSDTPCALVDLPAAVLSEEPSKPGPIAVELLCGAYRLEYGQVHRYLRSLPQVVTVSAEHDHELASLTALLRADVAQVRPGAGSTRSALLDLLLVHVLRRWLTDDPGADLPTVDDPAIAAALRRIHGSPRTPWTVQQLSAAAGMSRTAFTRRFTALVGTSPRAYVTGVRLALGARLLRETTAPLAAIAAQVGYSTEFAFGGAFRREYGVSPGRFRSS